MFRLLLFCGSKLSQVNASLRPTITGAIHSSLEHSTSNVKHTIVVQALVPPSTPLPPQSSSILQPSTTHTQTSCKHTHTHTHTLHKSSLISAHLFQDCAGGAHYYTMNHTGPMVEGFRVDIHTLQQPVKLGGWPPCHNGIS